MTLPSYFIADLPGEVPLSSAMLADACETLARNRRKYLAGRSTHSVIALLDSVASDWLKPQYPLRQLALEQGPDATGFSEETLATGLDAFFAQITKENLSLLVEQDLGTIARLDEICSSGSEEKTNRASLASGPEFLFHITSGNLPVPALHSILLGVLTRSAQFIKCASGTSLLPRLFAHSIHEADPKLASCIELAEWPGGDTALENVIHQAADCVTVTGSDKTTTTVRRAVPVGKRVLRYGSMASFACIMASAIPSDVEARKLAQRAAQDIAAWDQLGCLSPHVIYVQTGGAMSPVHFPDLLAEAMAEMEMRQPRGRIDVATAAQIASRRDLYELRASNSQDTCLWSSKGSTAWTVIYETDPQFQLSCLHRFIYVKGMKDLDDALHHAGTVREQTSTVGLAAGKAEARDAASRLAKWGARRICPLGRMQMPSLLWRHDGRPSLGDLITWTDWELES